jgi:hypothetical protein
MFFMFLFLFIAQVTGFPQPGHHTLEAEVSGAISEKPLIDIHNHCLIDVNSNQLVLKSEYFKRKPGSPGHE